MDEIITTLHPKHELRLPRRFAAKSSHANRREPLLRDILGLSRLTPFLAAPIFMLCAGLTLAPGHAEAARAAYTATEAGTLPPGSTRVVRAANDGGEIVGTAHFSKKGNRGFLLGDSGLQEIELPTGSDYNTAFGINKRGQVVGSLDTATGMRAYRSNRKTGVVLLETLLGDTSSSASAINTAGTIAGWSSGATGVQAVIWSPAGAIQALPVLPDSSSCRAQAINDRNDVVGTCDTTSGPRAVHWAGGTVQELGTLPGDYESAALGINNRGDIVGSSGNPEEKHYAVLWPAGGSIQNLGALPNRTWSQALAINDRKEVVGVSSEGYSKEHAFLWTEQDGLQDLNDLTSNANIELTHGIAISAQGLIVAIGHDKIVHTPESSHETHDLPLRIFRLKLKSPVGGP